MTAGSEYLTFTVGEQTYGMDILEVQEIKGGAPLTPVPNAPAYLRGVMNLRGTVVPVVDLRRRFGAPEMALGKFTVIIVAAVESRTLGFLVDTVSEVRNLAGLTVAPPPELNRDAEGFLSGVAAGPGELVFLLDLARLVAGVWTGDEQGQGEEGQE